MRLYHVGLQQVNLWDGLKNWAQEAILRAKTLLSLTISILYQNQILFWLSEVLLRKSHSLGPKHLSWFEGAALLWPQSQTAG